MSRDDPLEALAARAIDCGFHLHRDLGPGLLETAYEALLLAELRRLGIGVAAASAGSSDL